MSEVRLDDDRLAAVLASVGRRLVTDGAGAVSPTTSAPRRPWRPLLVAAVIIAVVAGLVAAVAPARRVVGGWLGVGRIEVAVDRTADPTGLPAFSAPAERIDPAHVEDVLGQVMPDVDGSSLGAPSEWWTLPEGGVLAGWPDGETSLWVTVSGDGDMMKKVVDGESVVTELPGLGDGGLAISGPHLLQTPHRRASADTVVIWTDGALTFRLDGAGRVDELVAIARQLAG
jgi:hypothetical protein